MIGMSFPDLQSGASILLLGAHCDDIEIGMGATILQLVRRYPEANFCWVTLSSDPERERETRTAAEALLEGAKYRRVIVESFRGSYFPYVGAEIKNFFETLKASLAPDVVFTHCRHDLHQDHRVTSELTWNTFRNHLILEYEIPKFDGDLRTPNCYVAVSARDLRQKIDILMTSFPSQLGRPWFTRGTFEAIARLRGIESNADEGYAEGFYCPKVVLQV